MSYVDGFVLPIPKKNVAAYRKLARLGSRVWREHGALDYRECVGDDFDIPMGLPFPRGLKLKRGETMVFAWILYKSRAHRNRVMAKAMKDSRLVNSCDPKKMPFDPKRVMWAGFKTLVK